MDRLFSQVKWYVDAFVMLATVIVVLFTLFGISCLSKGMFILGLFFKRLAAWLNKLADRIVYTSTSPVDL